jgi:glycosyltransferase involved in cell wall biosynthesis
MKITLVVPVLNAEPALQILLESIVLQSRRPDQMVFVDNGSSDRSLEMLLAFQRGHPDFSVSVLTERTRGPGLARNRAIAVCQGEVVAFTDADCRLDPHWTEVVVAFFDSHADVSLLGGVEKVDLVRSPTELYKAITLAHSRQDGGRYIESLEDWFDGRNVSTLNLAVRRQCLIELGGFEGWLAGEDMDFWMRARGRGFRIWAGEKKMVVFHHPRSTVRSFVRQQWQYALAVPCLLNCHFSGTGIVSTSRRRLTHGRFPTALLEINPHTTMLPALLILGWNAVWLYLFFLVIKLISFYRSTQKIGVSAGIWQCLATVGVYVLHRWIVSIASLVGSLRHNVMCIR